jgi:hypothetical protein
MSARRWKSDEELGDALSGLAVDWPATPPLTPAVAAAIRDAKHAPRSLRPRLSLPSRRRTVLIIVAALLVLAAAAVATKLVIDLGAETIRTTPGAPAPTLPVIVAPTFGERVSGVREASDLAGFEAVVPDRLGPPDGVWVWETSPYEGVAPAEQIVLTWHPAPGLPQVDELRWGAVLMQLTGRTELIAKTLYSDTSTVTAVPFEGAEAYWVRGEHTVTLLNGAGNGTVDVRVTGNVLVWEHGGRTMRLETALDLDGALGVARSIH